MKVNFISTIPPTKCGLATYTNYLQKALKKEKINVQIIPIKKPSSPNPIHFIKIAQKTIRKKEDSIIHIQFQLARFGEFLFLKGIYSPLLILWIKIFSRIPLIITLHDVPSHKDVGNKKKWELAMCYYNLIYFFIKNFCDKVIIHSKNGKKIAIEEWGFKEDKIAVIPHGVLENTHIINKEKAKKKMGCKGKNTILLFGYARDNKNFNLVIEAMKEMAKDSLLLITGGIQDKGKKEIYDSLIRKTAHPNIRNKIKILGYIPEKDFPILFSAVDIGLIPYSETLGDFCSGSMALQLAYNIPILASNIHPFEHFKKEHQCIETFNKDNKNDLVKKMSSSLKKKDKYVKKKIEKYLKKAGWSSVAKRHKKIYLNLIKK